ncbi:MAG: carboxylesterase family protein [Chitinophagaceae bacterium]|nr:carboxylesterase family protein [Chitinophagaceae bacterium]
MLIERRKFLKTAASSAGIVAMPFESIASNDNGLREVPKQTVDVGHNKFLVTTEAGKVRGYQRNGIHGYKGIPYGASTEGKNRFMAPQAVEPWTGVRNTLSWGPSAPSGGGRYNNAGHYPVKDMDAFSGSFTYHWSDWSYGEDCLRINVWTPTLNNNSKKAVLVWFHGGGFLYMVHPSI